MSCKPRVIIIHLVFLIWATVPCPAAPQAGPQSNAIEYGDTVISNDISWEGTVIIRGVVVVARTAALTISPGTTILFMRQDRNNDGIGDAEIRVLGQIKAIGLADSPITFRSGESSPAPKDWSYLLIFASGKQNYVQHCNFHNAFTGLQVHFSTAYVSDCIFSDNLEGIRFGRAKINFEHNRFCRNHIGVRFTRMEGPVEMKFNEITENRTGIFLVPSGQNILDFFEPGRTGKAWNEGHLAIISNNIYDNIDYNLKLGAKQMWDLKISNNWWGENKAHEVRIRIFDQSRDPELGNALIAPISQDKITAAGPRRKK